MPESVVTRRPRVTSWVLVSVTGVPLWRSAAASTAAVYARGEWPSPVPALRLPPLVSEGTGETGAAGLGPGVGGCSGETGDARDNSRWPRRRFGLERSVGSVES